MLNERVPLFLLKKYLDTLKTSQDKKISQIEHSKDNTKESQKDISTNSKDMTFKKIEQSIEKKKLWKSIRGATRYIEMA